ncbi:hypothetical protein [Terribacillus saccharophilus]|uniref:hypothetical protein n=1 Tax=Terribacillus saccharophilus TaxID=361277 RepID=UPI002DC81473|nr:hypothetical protein [Terribacillus saccharophilus]MEC0291735.1 hypothetical protein [Terribacillus saccharophilus]
MKLVDKFILLNVSTADENYGTGEVVESISDWFADFEQFMDDLVHMFLLLSSGIVLFIGILVMIISLLASMPFQSKAEMRNFWRIQTYIMLGFFITAVLIYTVPLAVFL